MDSILTAVGSPVVVAALVGGATSILIPVIRNLFARHEGREDRAAEFQTGTLEESAQIRRDLMGRIQHLEDELAKANSTASANAQALMDYRETRVEMDARCAEIMAQYEATQRVETELRSRVGELEGVVRVLMLRLQDELDTDFNDGV